MKKISKSKKSITIKWGRLRSGAKSVQLKLADFLLPLVLLMLILALVEVGFGNHALFHNTKLYEETSSLFKRPDYYSLSDMKVEISKTYYTIKEVVYVFRSSGSMFSTSQGVLTQGYYLLMYPRELLIVLVGGFYFISEFGKCFIAGLPIRSKIKERKYWGKGFLVALVLYVLLVVELLVPLL